MTQSVRLPGPSPRTNGLLVAFAINFIWINASEVFRYFIFVMPMMRDALPGLPDVAPMNVPTFLIWGVWDTILVAAATFAPWLILNEFGQTRRNAVLAGTAVWIAIFGILWIGLYNMNLATPLILATALPLAWIELVVAALIVRQFCFRQDQIAA